MSAPGLFDEELQRTSKKPFAIVRRFLVYFLREAAVPEARELADAMVLLAVDELQQIRALGQDSEAEADGANAFDGDWRKLLQSTDQEHCDFACFLAEVLLSVALPLKDHIVQLDELAPKHTTLVCLGLTNYIYYIISCHMI